MEGAALRATREYDLAIAAAWHGARFTAMTQTKKGLPGLSNFLAKKPEPKTGAAHAIAFFHSLKARGVDVKIERVER